MNSATRVESIAAAHAPSDGAVEFRLLVEHSSDLIFLLNPFGEVHYASPACRELLGCEPDELVGRPIHEIVHPENPGIIRHWRETAAGTEDSLTVEGRVKHPDGKTVWLETKYKSLAGLNGSAAGIHAVSRDITDRKRAEETLKREKVLLDTLIESVPGLFYVLDQTGHYLRWNESLQELLGLTTREMRESQVLTLIHGNDREMVASKMMDVFMNGYAEAEARLLAKDGVHHAMLTGRRMSSDGNVYLVGSGLDITDRRRAEEALRESERAQRNILGNIDEIIYMLRPTENSPFEGDVRFVSGRVEAILGYEPREFMEDRDLWFRLVHPEDMPAMVSQTRDIYQRKQPGVREYRMRVKTGEYRWIEDRVVPEVNDAGALVGVFGVARDVTDKRRAEQALRESEQFARASLDALEAHIAILDEEGVIVAVNKGWAGAERFLGEAVGRPGIGENYLKICDVSEIECGDQSSLVADAIRRIIAGQEEYNVIQYKREALDGPMWYLCRVTRFAGGEVGHVAIAHEDVTLPVMVESHWRSSEETFGSLVRMAPVGIFRSDADGNYLSVNARWSELAGLDELYAAGEGWASAIHPEDRARVLADWKQAARMHIPLRSEFRFVHPDESIVWVAMNSVAIVGDGGKPGGFIGTIYDLTDRIRSEEVLRTALREKEVLLKEIHHRVKNNLQVISSLLDMRTDSVVDEGSRDLLRESQHRVRSMAMIHEQLYQSDTLGGLDFGEYIHKLVTFLHRNYTSGTGIVRLVMDVAEDVQLNIDTAIPLGLILNELVSNAFKHAFKRGRDGLLRITLLKDTGDGQGHSLCVADDGPGLPADFDISKTSSMGLQLVRTLTRQLKAKLTIQGEQGTSMQINFKELVYAQRL